MKRAKASEGDLVAVPLPNGVSALVWMIEISGRNHTFLVMDTPTRPAKADSSRLPDEDDVWKGWFDGECPSDFVVVGHRALSARARGYASNYSGTMVFGDPERLRAELHQAWRLVHDRPALEAEWAVADQARQKRKTARKSTLTLAKLSRERAFARWDEYLPRNVVREVRTIFRDAAKELRALEKCGTKRQRVAALRRIVTRLNAYDDDKGFIESVERDQIIARIEELAALVGLTNEREVLTRHRDW
ncbi:MAG TPA: hypothetical protein VGH87_07020 [Polyangiaceae bacterium]|jgi:hypothetical protein